MLSVLAYFLKWHFIGPFLERDNRLYYSGFEGIFAFATGLIVITTGSLLTFVVCLLHAAGSLIVLIYPDKFYELIEQGINEGGLNFLYQQSAIIYFIYFLILLNA